MLFESYYLAVCHFSLVSTFHSLSICIPAKYVMLFEAHSDRRKSV